MGVWPYWMAQGVQVKNNLMHDNSLDIFLEVDHGPMLVSNNVLLSKTSLLMNSSGAAFVHNIFGGKIDVVAYDARLTPYHKPHSTYVVVLHDNPGGDIQFINNLFVNGGDASGYSKALLPVVVVFVAIGQLTAQNQLKPVDDFLKDLKGTINPSICWYTITQLDSTKSLVNGLFKNIDSEWLYEMVSGSNNQPDALDVTTTMGIATALSAMVICRNIPRICITTLMFR